MWRGKINEQAQAIKLRIKGKSLNEIAKELHVAKSSVSLWVRDTALSFEATQRLVIRSQRGLSKSIKTNRLRWQKYRQHHPKPLPDFERQKNLRQIKEFFDRWSPHMAYVLGLFAADGCMYHSINGGHSTGGWYIVFYSTDLSLITLVKKLIGIRNKIEVDFRLEPWKDKYFLRIVNKGLYKKFLALGMTPSKSLTLTFPTVPERFLSDFVRGYFDGDGCVYFNSEKRLFSTSFTSGSKNFLKKLESRLKQDSVVHGGSFIRRSDRHFVLQFSINDSRRLYNFMYPISTVPCLRRKKVIFERAFKELTK